MTLGITRRSAILLLAGILLAGNLGFYLWYRATAQQRKERMEARRIELIRDVEAREKEEASLGVQRARLSEVSSAIDEFYGKRAGPSRDNLAPIVLEIHNLLQGAGVLPATISYSTLPVAELPLSEMRVSFSFRNDYRRFKQLLAAIEADRKWIAVQEIALSRDPDIPGSVQVHMTLATYFAKDDSTVPPQVPKPGGSRLAAPSAGRPAARPPMRAVVSPPGVPPPGRPAVGAANRAAPAASFLGGPPAAGPANRAAPAGAPPAAAPREVRR